MKSISAFVRHLILYGFVYDVDYSELQKYNENLWRINSSLNQIARRMNATGHVYDEDVADIKKMMEELWHTQRSMLSRQPSIRQ